MEEVKLFGHWASPFSGRVKLALKLKGIPYECVEEDVMNKSQLLLQYNPVYKNIPVLVHCGKPISESLVILEYIDENWKEHALLPEDPYMRSKVRFWANYYDQKLHGQTSSIFLANGEEQQKAIKAFRENLMVLENGLQKDLSTLKPFLNGEQLGFMDVALGAMSSWIKVVEEVGRVKLIERESHPFICAWLDAFCDHEVVKNALPRYERLLAAALPFREKLLESNTA